MVVRRLGVLVVGALAVTACAGGDDDADRTTAAGTAPATVGTATSTSSTTSTTTTTTSTTVAPTTTIDEATVLAEIEQAFLDAFWVATEALRSPDDPKHEALIRQHFTGPNLDAALEDLRRMIDGGLVAKENPENPSLAMVIGEFELDESGRVAFLTVCEFNSDRIYEAGTGPDGADSLRRDNPTSYLVVVEMRLVAGVWKSATGNVNEQVSDRAERCSDVA